MFSVSSMRITRIYLLFTVTSLLAIGIVMIFSASSIYSLTMKNDSAFFLKRQVFFLFIGLIMAAASMSFDYRLLSRYSKQLIILSFVLLILVLLPGIGREVSGAKRWFRFGFFSFQPSEFVYLAIIIYTADFLSRKANAIENFFHGFLPPVLVTGFIVGLILLQPDLGTSIAILSIVILLMFIGGIKIKYIMQGAILGAPFLYFLIFSVPYRRARILSFLNPWADPRGSGFQIIQSQIALGSGGIFGKGLGKGIQKLLYLPAAHTDFIFSIIGEELGLIGTLGLICLFVILLILGIKIAKEAKDQFGFFLALGLVLMIVLKAVVNIGVSIGMFPTKGLPLPFISYGGSSLVFDMIAVGLLLNIAKRA
ncbi:MAG: putative lipid II flippase FtsW [Candidatus Omnitrophota bacterium]